jgi:cell division protein FtsB
MGAAIDEAIQKAQVKLQALAESAYRWRRKCATVAVAGLACWVAYHAVFGANGTMVYSNKRIEYKSLHKEIDVLKQENEQLAHQVQALKTDPRTIEKEAREQLRYARPGEVIYTVPQSQQVPSTATAQNH